MEESAFKKFFSPGPRGKLRWAIFGVLVLFFLAFFIDFIGFSNYLSRGLSGALKTVPVISDLRVWPKIEHSAVDNSKSLKFKSFKEIELASYGLPFRLGLDLLGGTHLVYDADVSQIPSEDRPSSLSGVRDVIERRVNSLGVSEPLIQTNQSGGNYRVIVELAGVYDVNQAIKMIGETPLLEFKEENPAATTLTLEQQKQLDTENKVIEDQAAGVLQQIKSGADFSALAKQYSEDPGSKENGGLYTGVKKGVFVPEFDEVIFNKLKVGELYPELVKTQFGFHIIKKEAERGSGDGLEVDVRHILFKTKTSQDLGIVVQSEWISTKLTGQQLKKARVEMDPNSGVPQVALEFNKEGADLFADITKRNTGKLVAIFLDGSPISIPRVSEPILSGQAVISGNFTVKDAKLLAQRLNAGALPVPVKLISQTTVGASLGSESVQKSLVAGIWGFLLVALFMIFYYRLPGVLSVVALVIYTMIALAIFKIFHVTMTLAGIAGFILSIGMAVDANILIFERLKEELRAGRNLELAITEGFHRAWSSIRDSNISSLITCAILFWFGSSIIRGFAVTLALGILVSMFSAITITRQLLKLVGKWRISKFRWFYNAKPSK
ncbi:MAG: protein translocase subunit SecD [Patescibacteria group bacterium]